MSVALAFSPHPDDEVIGAGGTLIELAQLGMRVINVALSLGRPEQHPRRRAELIEACGRAGFDLLIPDNLPPISSACDLTVAQHELRELIGDLLVEHRPAVVVSPSPHDRHHGHEVVARAVRDALRSCGASGPVWWMWGLWSELACPTLLVPLSEERLGMVKYALEAHTGECARNDYVRIVHHRAAAAAQIGFERVFGFGSPADPRVAYAELLCETRFDGDRFRLGRARRLDETGVVAPVDGPGLDWWLWQPTVTDRLGPPPVA